MGISLAFCHPCLCSFIIYRILGLDSLHNHHSDINSQHNSNFVEGQPYFPLLVWFTCDHVALCMCPMVASAFIPSLSCCMPCGELSFYAILQGFHKSVSQFSSISGMVSSITTESEKEGTLTQERGKPAFSESCAPPYFSSSGQDSWAARILSLSRRQPKSQGAARN